MIAVRIYGTFHNTVYLFSLGNTESVYDLLYPLVGHLSAEDAASWCELACVGDLYEEDEYEIEIVEG